MYTSIPFVMERLSSNIVWSYQSFLFTNWCTRVLL